MQNTDNDIIFTVNLESLQNEAMNQLNRKLNSEEIEIAKKCIDFGLSTSLEFVLKTSIDEAVKDESHQN